MNIKDFASSKQKNSNQPNSKNKRENILDENQEKVKSIEQDLNRYKNLSQNELLNEFMKEATKLKANGSLNEKNINALKSTLAPMLSAEQNQMLNQLLNMIK